MDLEHRFETIMATLAPAGPLVLGVSGGVDSLALLHLADWLRRRRPLALHIVHVHHGLRGADADADAEFVQAECSKLGVPCEVARIDVAALAKEHGRGIEEAARRARYSVLLAVARHVRAEFVVTAHNADDQAETILMHLLRGSGLDGLAGMQPHPILLQDQIDVRPDSFAIFLLRPLLDIWRAELEAYCAAKGLKARHDASNDDTHYFRNRIRHETMPYLDSLAPGFRRRLNQLGRIAFEQDESYAGLLGKVLGDDLPWLRRAWGLERFRDLDPGAQRYLIHRKAPHLSFAHVEAVLRLAENGQTGQKIDLPEGWRARLSYGRLYVEMGHHFSPSADRIEEAVAFSTPGVYTLQSGVELTIRRRKQAPAGEIEGWLLAPDTLTLPLTLRSRLPGDRLHLPGVGTQKLSDFLINRKVPREARDQLPLLIMKDRVIGVWGLWTDPVHRAAPGQPAWRISLRRSLPPDGTQPR